jgi:hypothetical protein
MSENSSDGKKPMLIAGYVCAVVALVLFPPGFGLAAVAIGIIALVRDRVGHGIAIIVIGVTCGLFGMYFGSDCVADYENTGRIIDSCWKVQWQRLTKKPAPIASTPGIITEGPFSYGRTPAYLVDVLCANPDVQSSRERLCYSSGWQPWLKELMRQTAGQYIDALNADSAVVSPGITSIGWNGGNRVVFHGCRPHACSDAYAYFIVAPNRRQINIIWKTTDNKVIYLGPNALYLRQYDAHGFLDRARSQ